MNRYKVYTRAVVVGQAIIMAHSEDEARKLVLEDIALEQFEPDISVTDTIIISKVIEEQL